MREARRRDPRLYPFPPWPTPPDVPLRARLSPAVPPAEAEGRRGEEPITLPPWLYPPFVSQPIDEPQNRIPAAIAAGGTYTIQWAVIPLGRTGICDRIGMSISVSADQVRITTRINNNPVPPLAGVIGAIGTLLEPVKLSAPIIIRAGERFSLTLENLSVGAIDLAARTLGWSY